MIFDTNLPDNHQPGSTWPQSGITPSNSQSQVVSKLGDGLFNIQNDEIFQEISSQGIESLNLGPGFYDDDSDNESAGLSDDEPEDVPEDPDSEDSQDDTFVTARTELSLNRSSQFNTSESETVSKYFPNPKRRKGPTIVTFESDDTELMDCTDFVRTPPPSPKRRPNVTSTPRHPSPLVQQASSPPPPPTPVLPTPGTSSSLQVGANSSHFNITAQFPNLQLDESVVAATPSTSSSVPVPPRSSQKKKKPTVAQAQSRLNTSISLFSDDEYLDNGQRTLRQFGSKVQREVIEHVPHWIRYIIGLL